jgi:hypothetical protein
MARAAGLLVRNNAVKDALQHRARRDEDAQPGSVRKVRLALESLTRG